MQRQFFVGVNEEKTPHKGNDCKGTLFIVLRPVSCTRPSKWKYFFRRAGDLGCMA